MTIGIREIHERDIPLIARYWLESDPEFLTGMGVDLDKVPSMETFAAMLMAQMKLPMQEKKSYVVIWELNSQPIGHSNVNEIEFGKQAKMHLHLWHSDDRKHGIGTELVKQSMPRFFETFMLEKLVCEPYALNPAPNRTLEKTGFVFVRRYRTIPGSITFEQEVNRWEITREQFEEWKLAHNRE